MAEYTREFLKEQIKKHGWTVSDGHTYGTPHVLLYDGDGKLHIGKYCSIAPDVTIVLGGNHRVDWVTTYPFSILAPEARIITGHPSTRGDVVIGNDVWIGKNCIIVSGVTIGNGACIAAGTVVSKDVPPYTLAGGNPSKVLKKRFTDYQIARLLEIAWWDWDEARIRANYALMLSDNIDKFINEHT